jgi:hypothetical protein
MRIDEKEQPPLTQGIPCTQEAFSMTIPEHEGERAAEVLGAPLIPPFVRARDEGSVRRVIYLGVKGAEKFVAVVQTAVEDEPDAFIGRFQRLPFTCLLRRGPEMLVAEGQRAAQKLGMTVHTAM